MEHLKLSYLKYGATIKFENDIVAIIKTTSEKQGARGLFLMGTLYDGEKLVPFKVWDINEDTKILKEPQKIIRIISGKIDKWENTLQVIITKAIEVTKDEILNKYFFLLDKSKITNEELIKRYEIIKNINDKIKNVFSRFENNKIIFNTFMNMPAAKSIHQAYSKGLLEHSLNVVESSLNLYNLYSRYCDINKDVLIIGSFFHDIGKIQEYKLSELGLIQDTSIDGILFGHLYLGPKILEPFIVDLEENEKININHILVSHHGEPEFGTIKIPSTIEAIIVHYSDLLDSTLSQIYELKDKNLNEKIIQIKDRKIILTRENNDGGNNV